MKITCSRCRESLGSKAPHDDLSETHGLCWPCARLLYGDGIVDRAIAAMEKPATVKVEIPEDREFMETL